MKNIWQGLVVAGIGFLIFIGGFAYANSLRHTYHPSGAATFFAIILILGGALWTIVCLLACAMIYKENYDRENDPLYFQKKQEERNRKLAELEQERLQAELSQKDTSPWAIRYATSPCPYCGHYKVRSAKWEDKRMSVAFWGVASSKIGKRFKCEHCNMMWS